jgi:hypothetical protein
MYTVKFLHETDIEKVHKSKKKIKVNGQWFTLWYDSLDCLYINLNEHQENTYPDVYCIPYLLETELNLVAMYK